MRDNAVKRTKYGSSSLCVTRLYDALYCPWDAAGPRGHLTLRSPVVRLVPTARVTGSRF